MKQVKSIVVYLLGFIKITFAKPALCAPFDSMCFTYVEKSLNSSQVGRKTIILKQNIVNFAMFHNGK